MPVMTLALCRDHERRNNQQMTQHFAMHFAPTRIRLRWQTLRGRDTCSSMRLTWVWGCLHENPSLLSVSVSWHLPECGHRSRRVRYGEVRTIVAKAFRTIEIRA